MTIKVQCFHNVKDVRAALGKLNITGLGLTTEGFMFRRKEGTIVYPSVWINGYERQEFVYHKRGISPLKLTFNVYPRGYTRKSNFFCTLSIVAVEAPTPVKLPPVRSAKTTANRRATLEQGVNVFKIEIKKGIRCEACYSLDMHLGTCLECELRKKGVSILNGMTRHDVMDYKRTLARLIGARS